MHIFTSLPQQRVLDACALTVGTFDGVHRGHQLLVENLKSAAARRQLPTAAFTFQDMPFCFFRPDDCPRLLTLKEEKIAAFAALGVDHLFIVPFDAAIARTPYDVFVGEVLVRRLGMKLLTVGPDFALGKNRAGDVAALKSCGEALGFEVCVLEGKLEDGGAPISSTRVRGAVENGEMENAARMLGHAFSLEGAVVPGKKLGRALGVPTINLKIHPRKVLPKNGIYAARALFDDGSTHAAALSIGTNPTTDAGENIKVEFHVIDENIAAPPETARLEVVARLRDEAKFDSLAALVAQMKIDIQRTRTLLL
jgi:riboflavin kinase/FMN adenylyltransferase